MKPKASTTPNSTKTTSYLKKLASWRKLLNKLRVRKKMTANKMDKMKMIERKILPQYLMKRLFI